MSPLGELLRERREARGFSLQSVSSTTKIREHILAALESGAYECLPAPVFVRGFLRTLARQLGLDAEELLALYVAAVPQSVASSSIALSTNGSNGNGHVNRHVNGHGIGHGNGHGTPEPEASPPPDLKPHIKPSWVRPTWLSGNVLMSGLIVLLLLVGVAWGGDQMLKGLGQSQPARALAQLKPTLEAIVLEPTPTEAFALNPTPSLSPVPATPVSIFAATPTPLTAQRNLEVRLDMTGRSWVRVDADGVSVFQGILEAGTSKTFSARSRITLRAGNGAGVSASVNGSSQAPLGASGDVVDRQWVLNDSGAVASTPPVWSTPP